MPEARPNIIFITTDQQRLDTIHALEASHMDTPNLDRLVSEGVSFTDCHVTAPSCAPSRGSLFTGYYPHTTGNSIASRKVIDRDGVCDQPLGAQRR